jgi:uncharacterized protein (TIGR03435 family)
MRGVSAFVGLTGLFAFGSSATFGQSAATPAFEVASVRPSAQPIRRGAEKRGGPGTSDPERISYMRFQMLPLLTSAFRLKVDEIVGPDWISNYQIAYDIEVKVKPGSTEEQVNQMMQNLLRERFGLAFHFEQRSFIGYDLVLGKGGSKLRLAAPPDPAAPTNGDSVMSAQDVTTDRDGFPIVPPGKATFRGVAVNHHMRLTVRKEPLTLLLQLLEGPAGTDHLVDKTGLNGIYDFELDYALRAPGAEVDDQAEAAPDIFTAVQKQLGLSLEKTKVTSDVLIIDHIEKTPTGN